MLEQFICILREKGDIREMAELMHKAKNTILCDNFITVNTVLHRRKKAAMQKEIGSKTQEVPHIPVNKVSSGTTYSVSFSKQHCSNQFHNINIIENNFEFEFPLYIIHVRTTVKQHCFKILNYDILARGKKSLL